MTKQDAQDELASIDIQPGDIYRHYKGGIYSIVCLSVKEDTQELLVTYRSNKNRTNWTRTLENFQETLTVDSKLAEYGIQKDHVRRFERVLT